MPADGPLYSAKPTRNPFRYLRSAWRLVRSDPAESTEDAAIVEIGFARSRFGRRFARWEETLATLRRDPRTATALVERRLAPPIDLAELATRPPGSLGRVLADHCASRGVDPNLVDVPPDDEVGWLLHHLYRTHDVWHVVTGWGNDLPGEVGLGAFYAAQLGSPPFFGYMSALIFLNVVSRRADLDGVFAAFSAGYRMGRHAEPLFGLVWDDLWSTPVAELRERFRIDRSELVGEGIPEAA